MNSEELTLIPGTSAIIQGITIKAHPIFNSTTKRSWNRTISLKMSPLISINPTSNYNVSVINHLRN